MEPPELKYRMSRADQGFITIVGLCCDITSITLDFLGFIYVAQFAISIFGQGAMLIYFFSKGASFVKSKGYMKTAISSWIIGLIPILGNFTPELAVAAFLNARRIRKEDEENYKKAILTYEQYIKEETERQIEAQQRLQEMYLEEQNILDLRRTG